MSGGHDALRRIAEVADSGVRIDDETRKWFLGRLDEKLWTMGWKRAGGSMTHCVRWSTKAESARHVDELMATARRVLRMDPLQELRDAADGKSH